MTTKVEIFNYSQGTWELYKICYDWWDEFRTFAELEELGYSREKDIRSRIHYGDYTCPSKNS